MLESCGQRHVQFGRPRVKNSKLLEEVLVSLLVEAVEVQSSSLATVHQGPSRALIVSYYLVSHILEQFNSLTTM